jgi:hypothetical protein
VNFEHISCLCGSRHYGSALFDGEKAARRMMVLSAAVLYADKIKEPCRLPVCRLFYRCELVVDTLFLVVVDIASNLVVAWLYDKFRNDIVLFSLNTGKGFCDVVTMTGKNKCIILCSQCAHIMNFCAILFIAATSNHGNPTAAREVNPVVVNIILSLVIGIASSLIAAWLYDWLRRSGNR